MSYWPCSSPNVWLVPSLFSRFGEKDWIVWSSVLPRGHGESWEGILFLTFSVFFSHWIFRIFNSDWVQVSPNISVQMIVTFRLVPNSWQPAELTGYLGRLSRLLLWYIYFFQDKLFVPLLAQIFENETYFPSQFIDLKTIWLAER